MTTGRKLIIGGIVVASVTAYMAYVGASASWSYYVTVDDCLGKNQALLGDRVRVSGEVVADTLSIANDRRQASFSLQGTEGTLPVVYSGSLPDNLAENIEVVVEGLLEDSGILQADKIITRCASKYESEGTS